MRRCKLVWLFLGAWLSSSTWALQASIDRNSIAIGETVNLTLQVDEQDTVPNLMPLRQDFDIVGSSQRQQVTIINGQQSVQRSWVMTLVPKRQGHLTIPALRLGGATTKPLTIEVRPVAHQSGRDVVIEATATPLSPYVQAELHYRVRLYIMTSLESGVLSEPSAANTIIKRQGQERVYDDVYQGHTAKVIERHYALFPQRSGTLHIKAPTFLGATSLIMQQALDPFALQPHRRVQAAGRNLDVTVRPKPAQVAAAAWVPARSLTVTASWSTPPAQWRVGEPVTQTIRLRAEGLTAEQLPALSLPTIPQLNRYAEKPALKTQFSDATSFGERVEKITFIPQQAGLVTIPTFKIDWWDVKAERLRSATVPGVQATVAAVAAPTVAAPIAVPPTRSTFVYGVAIALGGLWLLTLWLYWRLRQRLRGGVPPVVVSKASSDRIILACQQGDAPAARDALLQWARQRWPEHSWQQLGDLAAHVAGTPLQAPLAGLMATLYASAVPDDAWRDALPRALEHFGGLSETEAASPAPSLLPDLHLIQR